MIAARRYLSKLHSSTFVTSIVEVPICCLPSWFVRNRQALVPLEFSRFNRCSVALVLVCNSRLFAHALSHACIASSHRVIEPMLYATGGSILGARLALARGWAINLGTALLQRALIASMWRCLKGGGYHHASATSGSGFCVFAGEQFMFRFIRSAVCSCLRCCVSSIRLFRILSP